MTRQTTIVVIGVLRVKNWFAVRVVVYSKPSNLSTDLSKAVPTLFFSRVSFGVSGRLCIVVVAYPRYLLIYSRTSIPRTPMARLSWLIRIRI